MRTDGGWGRALSPLAFAVWSCAVPLSEDSPSETPDPLPVLPTCYVAGDGGDSGAVGRAVSWTDRDGGHLLHVDSRVTAAGAEAGSGLTRVLPDGCLHPGDGTPWQNAGGVDTSAHGGGTWGSLLSVWIDDNGAPHAFVRIFRGFASEGVALADFAANSGRFVARDAFLFTGDRPSFGDASLVEDGYVYAYGCASSGFLSESCFVGRAETALAGEFGAWEFYAGSNDFVADIDEAWPVFEGGSGLAVLRSGDRILTAYATPLGDRIVMRSALGPFGPWSAPFEMGRCDAPDEGFCTGFSFHPWLEEGGDAPLPLSYAIASFGGPDAVQRRTRLVRVDLADLP